MGLLGLIWGASFLSIKVGLDELPFLTLVAHRVLWAAILLWLYVLIKGSTIPRNPLIWLSFLVMGILNNVIPFGLMAWGQQFIETGLTSIFNAGTAIFAILVAAVVFADERLTFQKGAGVLVAFFGVCVAIGLDSFREFDIRSLAQLAVIGGTVSYAFAAAWARKTLKGLTPEVSAAGMLTGASLVIVPIAVAVDGIPTVPSLPQTYASIFYFSCIATAFAYIFYYRVISMAGSGNAMLVTLLVPPVAIALGALVLGERLSAQAFLGFGILTLGLIIVDGRVFKRRH